MATLREYCPYSEFLWSVFSRIWTENRDTPYLSVFNPNTSKYGPENLRIVILFYVVTVSELITAEIYINHNSKTDGI